MAPIIRSVTKMQTKRFKSSVAKNEQNKTHNWTMNPRSFNVHSFTQLGKRTHRKEKSKISSRNINKKDLGSKTLTYKFQFQEKLRPNGQTFEQKWVILSDQPPKSIWTSNHWSSVVVRIWPKWMHFNMFWRIRTQESPGTNQPSHDRNPPGFPFRKIWWGGKGLPPHLRKLVGG